MPEKHKKFVWLNVRGVTPSMYETMLDIDQVNDEIHFGLHVINHYDFPVTFVFSSGKKYEIVVENRMGEKVYNSSEGMFYIQALQEITIKQNEQKRWKIIWELSQLPPEIYVAHAKIMPTIIKPNQTNMEQLQISKTFEIK